MKRGRIGVVIAVILAATMLFTFTLAACGENSHEHSLTHVDARESTCTSEGNIEHWQCTSCGKYFKDADATIEATWGELQLPSIEHDYDPFTHRCKNCDFYDSEGAQNGLTYALNEQKNGYVVTDCGESMTVAEISAEINGLPVVGIEEKAFENCSNLTGITIPDSVTSIGIGAFRGCSGLTSMTIPFVGEKADGTGARHFSYIFGASINGMNYYLPKSLKEVIITGGTGIGDEAFSGCSGLTNVTILGKVTYISRSAFDGCSGLTSVTIGDGVEEIGSQAFYGCTNLSSVNIPNSVKEIGSSAFRDCISLQSIFLPIIVNSVGQGAFSGCSQLTIMCEATKDNWSDEWNGDCNVQWGCNAVNTNTDYDYVLHDGKAYLTEYKGKETDITVPTVIDGHDVVDFGNAYQGNTEIVRVVIPEGFTRVESYAFAGCSKLSELILSEGLTEFGRFAIEDTQVAKLSFPSSLVKIEGSSFNNSKSLIIDIPTVEDWLEVEHESIWVEKNSLYIGGESAEAIVIPSSVTEIGRNAFSNFGNIKTVILQNGVTSIGENAFSGCGGLTSITIPNSVTSIGDNAFEDCSGLTSVTIPDSVTSIGNSAFSGCSDLTSVTIGNGLTSIDWGAFFGCNSLDEIIVAEGNPVYHSVGNCIIETASKTLIAGCKSSVIPDDGSVTSIGNGAFRGCSGLISIVIPDSVTSIGNGAFRGCSGLTSITIPGSVTNIGNGAFEYCSSLTSITVPFVGEKADGTGATHFGYIFGASDYSCNNDYVPKSLKEVIITGGTSIGYAAFEGCSGLTSVTIPDSVTSIGSWAFSGCSGLTSITIPDSVTSIGDYAFEYCSGLTSVTIGNGVTSIGNYAFSGCSGLTSVTIPDSVTSIGYAAFEGCSGLTSVTIGNGVTSIGRLAFDGCSGLTDVYYQGDMTGWLGIEFANSYANPMHYADNLYINEVLQGAIVIPDGTEKIGDWAFSGCSGLTSVVIPDSVNSIGDGAFYGCSGLTSVTIGNGVTSIGDGAFYGCSGLTSVTIGNSVTSISYEAFYGCSGLTSVTIPDSATSIGYKAFWGCSGLTSVTIPDSVTSIGTWAFVDCSSLTNITIPNSVTSIGWRAFWGCSGLTSVTIGNGVTSFDSAFWECSGLTDVYYQGDLSGWLGIEFSDSDSNPMGYAANLYINGKLLQGELVIPDGTEKIGDYAFHNCSSLTSVVIPDSVNSIGERAFYGCNGLTSVTIGNGVTSIGEEAFYQCSGLTSVTIGNGVTSIGERAFSWCSGLTSVTIGNGVTSIGEQAFYGCSDLTSITIPDSVTSIGYSAFSADDNHTLIIQCEANSRPSGWDENWTSCIVVWGYPDNNIATDGNTYYTDDFGITYLLSDGNATVVGVAKGQNSVLTIPEQIEYNGNSYVVTEIAEKVLYDHDDLTSIVIPDSVTSIGSRAFYGCSGLTSVTIGNSVTSIGSDAFYGCLKLIEVYNKSALDIVAGSLGHGYIGAYAKNVYTEEGGSQISNTDDGYRFLYDGENGYLIGYYGPDSEITLPSSFVAYDGTAVYEYGIYANALYGCDNLTTIMISDGATSIGSSAFYGCSGLTSITIPDSVTSIGYEAFYGCSGLTSVTIPDSVTSIDSYAFYGCSGLTSITIPDSVTSIGYSVFSGCSDLTSITIPNSVTSIGWGEFADCSGLTSITIPDSVIIIGDYAFSNCSGLTSITIPDSVTSIGDYAFRGCSGLTTINFQGTMAQWQAIEKGSYWDNLTGEYAVHCTDGTISKADA